ncbi:MAG: c-type cytochrome [Chloroflexi bacterium]|nr:c-type cytochrome [Chloroflexota bacterium]
MAARWLKAESGARLFVIGILIGIPLAILIGRWIMSRDSSIEIHARIAEAGGFTPANLTAKVGEPLRLRLISDDVQHGFAIGQSNVPALDLSAGQVVETTLTFDRAGKYVFYCTRWCGLSHWRMRGTIEVTGEPAAQALAASPLYLKLNIDLDDPHPAKNIPSQKPIAKSTGNIPANFLARDYYLRHSPSDVFAEMRSLTSLPDDEVWNLVAFIWQSNTTQEKLAQGQKLYAQNCAACHGESGRGDGVMAASLTKKDSSAQMEFGHSTKSPVSFTDSSQMLGASPALLQGKIIRGGMGTGMPYWGPIFTEEQTWALVDYLWTFQFEYAGQ